MTKISTSCKMKKYVNVQLGCEDDCCRFYFYKSVRCDKSIINRLVSLLEEEKER